MMTDEQKDALPEQLWGVYFAANELAWHIDQMDPESPYYKMLKPFSDRLDNAIGKVPALNER